MKKIKNSKGITLIALVITIVVLLILAAISLTAIIGDDGILSTASKSKKNSISGKERELLDISVLNCYTNNKNKTLTKNQLQAELDKKINEVGEAKIETTDEIFFKITFENTKNVYEIENDGTICDYTNVIPDANPGKIDKDINGEELVGNVDSPYQINCIEDLIAFSIMSSGGDAELGIDAVDFSGKTVEITRDLNFKSTMSYTDASNTTMFKDYNGDGVTEGIKEELNKIEKTGFKPITINKATLDGKNHTIKNFYMNANETTVGSIGMIIENIGVIKNLTLEGTFNVNMFQERNSTACIGVFAGENTGEMTNLTNKCVVNVYTSAASAGTAWTYAGGITGVHYDSDTSLTNCANLGDINVNGYNDNRIGGIAGRLGNGSKQIIELCYNTGNIRVESLDYACVGGIVGDSMYSEVKKCYNTGNLYTIGKVRNYNGGITSSTYNGTITQCYNNGTLTSKGYAPRIAGITGSAGGNSICTISDCYNRGYIKTEEGSSVIRIAGIMGERLNSATVNISNCYSSNDFEMLGGVSAKGGIFGSNYGSVTNCYYTDENNLFTVPESSANNTITNVEEKTMDELKETAMLNILDNGRSIWKADTAGVNNYLPILAWQ